MGETFLSTRRVAMAMEMVAVVAIEPSRCFQGAFVRWFAIQSVEDFGSQGSVTRASRKRNEPARRNTDTRSGEIETSRGDGRCELYLVATLLAKEKGNWSSRADIASESSDKVIRRFENFFHYRFRNLVGLILSQGRKFEPIGALFHPGAFLGWFQRKFLPMENNSTENRVE